MDATIGTIVCTSITALAGVFGSFLAVQKGNKDREITDAKRDQKIEDRLCALEKKVDIHNGYAEKFGSVSNDITKIQKDIEYLKGKI